MTSSDVLQVELKMRKYDEVNSQDIQTSKYNNLNSYLQRLNGAEIKTTSPIETVYKKDKSGSPKKQELSIYILITQ